MGLILEQFFLNSDCRNLVVFVQHEALYFILDLGELDMDYVGLKTPVIHFMEKNRFGEQSINEGVLYSDGLPQSID